MLVASDTGKKPPLPSVALKQEQDRIGRRTGSITLVISLWAKKPCVLLLVHSPTSEMTGAFKIVRLKGREMQRLKAEADNGCNRSKSRGKRLLIFDR